MQFVRCLKMISPQLTYTPEKKSFSVLKLLSAPTTKILYSFCMERTNRIAAQSFCSFECATRCFFHLYCCCSSAAATSRRIALREPRVLPQRCHHHCSLCYSRYSLQYLLSNEVMSAKQLMIRS